MEIIDDITNPSVRSKNTLIGSSVGGAGEDHPTSKNLQPLSNDYQITPEAG